MTEAIVFLNNLKIMVFLLIGPVCIITAIRKDMKVYNIWFVILITIIVIKQMMQAS